MRIILDRESKISLYLQIRNQIRRLIQTHTFPPGYCLPPERKLATTLGVNRSTVVNAYRELEADGLIESHVGKGTIVKPMAILENVKEPDIPVQPLIWKDFYNRQSEKMYNPALSNILDHLAQDDLISFAAGAPALETYPLEKFAQINSNLIMKSQGYPFEYSSTLGLYSLREYLAEFMAARGIETQPENIIIISGSQQGLDLLAKIFLEPGDAVVVEEPTYLGAIGVFNAAGAHILTVPVDENGLCTDILEQILARHRPKFIYSQSTFQNPTGVTMASDRRMKLLQLAYRYHVPIVEDDAYGELYYDTPRVQSLKAMDDYNHVIYLSTFSKILFPGLRLGWIVAPSSVIDMFELAKQHADLHSGTTVQWLITEFCRQSLLEEHLHNVRDKYTSKRNVMLRALEKYSPPGLSWNVPKGGFYLWCQLPLGINATTLLSKASEKKVAFLPGDAFYVSTGGQDKIRLCYSRCPQETIEEGILRICEALTEISQAQSSTQNSYNPKNRINPFI
ncbi:PLP-dependent aminotransferase family protein [Desulfosporosinus sp. SB140]|uniref:MocR-like pyridoxine biosynthesis transcription factor PdxR n=1 Tax=Desulfosporosinus paludis TaxID=3115649 RepID=UPI00388F2700